MAFPRLDMPSLDRISSKILAALLVIAVPVMGWTVKQIIDLKARQDVAEVRVVAVEKAQVGASEKLLVLQQAMVVNSAELATVQKAVSSNSADLAIIAQQGSGGLKAHLQVDDQREIAESARIGRLEVVVDKLVSQSEKWSEAVNDIKWIKAEMMKGTKP